VTGEKKIKMKEPGNMTVFDILYARAWGLRLPRNTMI
jgi:hypothetical protein